MMPEHIHHAIWRVLVGNVIFDVGTGLIPASVDGRVPAILVLEAHLGCIRE